MAVLVDETDELREKILRPVAVRTAETGAMRQLTIELIDLKVEYRKFQSDQRVQILMLRIAQCIVERWHKKVNGVRCSRVNVRHLLLVHHVDISEVGRRLMVEHLKEIIFSEEQQPTLGIGRDAR